MDFSELHKFLQEKEDLLGRYHCSSSSPNLKVDTNRRYNTQTEFVNQLLATNNGHVYEVKFLLRICFEEREFYLVESYRGLELAPLLGLDAGFPYDITVIYDPVYWRYQKQKISKLVPSKWFVELFHPLRLFIPVILADSTYWELSEYSHFDDKSDFFLTQDQSRHNPEIDKEVYAQLFEYLITEAQRPDFAGLQINTFQFQEWQYRKYGVLAIPPSKQYLASIIHTYAEADFKISHEHNTYNFEILSELV